MSNQLQATNTHYQLEATTAGGHISTGAGCQVNICDYLCTRISIFHGNNMAGRINLILRDSNYDPSKLIGNIFFLPNGLPIEYVVVSSAYSLRFERYLDKYMAVVVYPKDSNTDATYIPFEPIVTTKDQQYKPDPALAQRIRDDNIEYHAEKLLKKRAFEADVEQKVKELSIAPKKTTEGCVPAAIDNSTYIEVQTF